MLVISASSKFVQFLTALLPESQFDRISVVADAGSAKRKLLENSFDIAVIDSPLPDEFGTRLAIDISSTSGTGVMLLARAEHLSDIFSKVTSFGVIVISKPVSSQSITHSLLLLCGIRERLRRMEQKTASIEDKMDEIRIVNKAKWMLIEHEGMTEAEAHRYIEKQSMDNCTTKRSTAEEIINRVKD